MLFLNEQSNCKVKREQPKEDDLLTLYLVPVKKKNMQNCLNSNFLFFKFKFEISVTLSISDKSSHKEVHFKYAVG